MESRLLLPNKLKLQNTSKIAMMKNKIVVWLIGDSLFRKSGITIHRLKSNILLQYEFYKICVTKNIIS